MNNFSFGCQWAVLTCFFCFGSATRFFLLSPKEAPPQKKKETPRVHACVQLGLSLSARFSYLLFTFSVYLFLKLCFGLFNVWRLYKKYPNLTNASIDDLPGMFLDSAYPIVCGDGRFGRQLPLTEQVPLWTLVTVQERSTSAPIEERRVATTGRARSRSQCHLPPQEITEIGPQS